MMDTNFRVREKESRLTLQNDVQALHLIPNFEAIPRRLHTVENNRYEWSPLRERNYDTGRLLLVLLEVNLASEMVELLVMREVNHPMWVMEGVKGSMGVIVVALAAVAMNEVDAGGSAEMIERVKSMKHEQRGARWLV
jgi:hypothetical protein